MHMKKILLLTLLFAFSITLLFSQIDNPWYENNTARSTNIVKDKAVARQTFPKEFKLFNLNITAIKQQLLSITGKQASKKSTVITLPNAAGKYEQFELFEASNFEPALQAKFPEIRAFSGKGITDKAATLKLSISPQGVQTMVFRTDTENEFIEPYSKDHTTYAVFTSGREKGKLPWTCSTADKQLTAGINAGILKTNKGQSSTGQLKTMRLAQSVTAEYSNFFGATSVAQVGLVLAAINATLTRSNGVYEKDLAIHLNLITNTADVIYYNPATDPYSPADVGAGGAWNGELQATLTSVIGDANYDIGHLFGASGGGGNAGCIGCVCGTGKGSGFTSPIDDIPQGDNFDIDYVVHEVGHQLGGTHTFSMRIENGSVSQKEVGSGITIMGYAGITDQDVAPHSIDIFHATSIAQIQANMATKTCPVTTVMTAANNATPVVDSVPNYTIPISTPFALTGAATDANAGDVLTYCWEQNDNGTTATTGVNSVASPTKLIGPNWLSFKPTISPTRYFPRLSTILAGALITGPLPGGDAGANIEALSSVARALNFRLTVRDNSPYVPNVKAGQTAFRDMTVNVSAAAGPVRVTVPNTNVTWISGATQTVTWDVARSDIAPISCANVKISLSTDGGLTFPTVLLASTPNDGTEAITVPSASTGSARIKIEAVGNIFFDISNANFVIASAASDFVFNAPVTTSLACGSATTANATISTTSVGGYVVPAVLSASGNPAGTTVSFAPASVIPGNNAVVTLNAVNTLAPGTYTVTVTGTSGSVVHTVLVTYIVTPGTGPVINTNPVPQIVCTGTPATFAVASATAVNYQWQQSTDTGRTWVSVSGATSATYSFTVTAAQNGYRYRCICSTICGSTISNAAPLAVVTLSVGGTLSPASLTVCGPVNSTKLTLTGYTGNILQWQYSTDGGITFPNIVTNTTATLTATNIAASRIYRAVVQASGCTAAFSATATLTYVAAAADAIGISANLGTTICKGDPTLLTVGNPTAAGPCSTPSGSINLAIPDGNAAGLSSSLNVSCAPAGSVLSTIAVTLNIAHSWDSDLTIFLKSPTGRIINLVNRRGGNGDNFTNTVISSASTNSLVTGTAPFTGTFTADAAATAASPAGFVQTDASLAAFISNTPSPNGTWVLGVRDNSNADAGTIQNWSLSLGYNTLAPPPAGLTYAWSPATGLSNTSGNPVAASPDTNTTYSVLVTNPSGCTATASVAIRVNSRPAIISQPTAVKACAGSTANFSVTATGTGVTYQWQVSTDNCSTYTNIAGATTATLSINAVTATLSNTGYRCIVGGTCTPSILSNCVKLTVDSLPAVTVTPSATCGGVAGINGILLNTGGIASPPPIPGTATFSSATSVAIPDNSPAGVTSAIIAAGIPANATITNFAVTLNMTHTFNGDMVFALKAPNGNVLNLDYFLSGSALVSTGGTTSTTGFVNTVISSSGTAALSTANGGNTFTGTFKADAQAFSSNPPMAPTGFASALTTVGSFAGLYSVPNGVYTLGMYDGGAIDEGTLTSWSIKIDYTTPAPGTAPITYTWSPAAGLYTNATATIPYAAGTQLPAVYAAPASLTTYTATATTTATGCTNTASAIVNYKPTAPVINPAPSAMCYSDSILRLTKAQPQTVCVSSGTIAVRIPDANDTGVVNSLSPISIPAGAIITEMKVILNVKHTWAGDMVIALKAPNGKIFNLDYGLSATGGAGPTTGFTNTVISSLGTTALSSGSGTFTGIFKADASIAVNAGPIGFTPNVNTWSGVYPSPGGVYTLGIADLVDGDEGTLTSWQLCITYIVGTPSTAPVWAPVEGLFTNSTATVPYIAGTPKDTVYFRPSTVGGVGSYNYKAVVNSLPPTPSAATTNFDANNGNFLVTYNFRNNNSYPVTLYGINGQTGAAGSSNVEAFYNLTPVSAPPAAISTATGWASVGKATIAGIGGVLQPFLTGLSLVIPANTTYGFAVQADGPAMDYSTLTPGNYVFTTDGCSIITGTNIGYGGSLAPEAPTFTPRGFIGSMLFGVPVGVCTSDTARITVKVDEPIRFTKPVADSSFSVCIAGTTSLTTGVTGTLPVHQWQVSTNLGGSFTNIVNGVLYGGANTATLTITGATAAMNNYIYRDSVSSVSCGYLNSGRSILKINPLPVIVISANPYQKLFPGLRTIVSSTVTPAAATYTWLKNGVVVTGSAKDLPVEVDGIGNYTLRVTDVNGCTNISNQIAITDSLSTKVFISPSPTTGLFSVRYNSIVYNTGLPRGVNIYDATGKRVQTQSYSTGSPYAKMNVDLTNHGTGVYTVEVVDVNGNRLAVGRVSVIR
jgi:subtilisin-like proprotein convertase family protein